MKGRICRSAAVISLAVLLTSGVVGVVGAPVYLNALPSPVIVNPSFEDGPDISQFPFYVEVSAVDSTTIPGWTVLAGTVDQVGHWVDADGQRAIDMTGTSPGVIQQLVYGFIPGQPYQLSFAMAGNPHEQVIKSLAVNIGASTEVFTFDITGRTVDNMGWITQTLDFLAVGEAMTLTFASLTGGVAGAAVDNVSIVLIPEPTTTSFLALAAMGAFLIRKRRAV